MHPRELNMYNTENLVYFGFLNMEQNLGCFWWFLDYLLRSSSCKYDLQLVFTNTFGLSTVCGLSPVSVLSVNLLVDYVFECLCGLWFDTGGTCDWIAIALFVWEWLALSALWSVFWVYDPLFCTSLEWAQCVCSVLSSFCYAKCHLINYMLNKKQ